MQTKHEADDCKLRKITVLCRIGGATPKFLGGPNLRHTQSITSFSTQDNN